MKSYTLGLDIGSKSIGWVLLENSGKPSISAIGVRVFPESIGRDKGTEVSKYKSRREARGARRLIQRRRFRKDRLVKILWEAGFLPRDKKELHDLLLDAHTRNGQEPNMYPYKLRAKGISERLERFEFGRVLYHLAQRRGFKSNSKSGQREEKNKISEGANELKKKITDAGCKTLGQYFASLDPHSDRVRGWYTFRDMYQQEFEEIWKKQAEYHSELTEELRKKVQNETIFYQRPLRSSEHLIGKCELEPEEPRCPRGDWYARRFRFLQDVNNLKIRNRDGSERKLTDKQREIVLDELEKKSEVAFSSLRKKLQKLSGCDARDATEIFNLEEDGRKEKLRGDEFAAAMIKIMGIKTWESTTPQKKVAINDALLELDDDSFTKKMAEEHELNQEQIEAILDIELPSKYVHFSRKAIQKLLPFMERGFLTSEAVNEVYKNRDKGVGEKPKEQERLGIPPNLRNPLVQTALQEVRKFINSLIAEYGKPSHIVIEMARDLKGSKNERLELQKKMWENEKVNKTAIVKLKELGYRITSDNILKYKLWEECGYKCLYTGRSISDTALFGQHPEFQVEHILPYSRSLDDSYMNKTLCEVHENIHVKKNKTPYEAYHNKPEKYDQIKQMIAVLPYPKRRKFQQEGINLDECIKRELEDTRYICKEAMKYLKQLSGIKVSGTKGRVTSELRHSWGLNTILDTTGSGIKNRADHRHHTIDAAVVAVTKNGHLRKLAESKYSEIDSEFPQPWPHFREELAEKVKHINVSHRPTKKTSGKLHEATSYGLTTEVKRHFDDGKIMRLSDNAWLCRETFDYVYSRTPAELFKAVADLDIIPGDANNVWEAVEKRLVKSGINIKDKNAEIPEKVFAETVFIETQNGKKIPIKKIRVKVPMSNMIILTDQDGIPYRACPAGVKNGNHHVEIFEQTDGNGQTKRIAKIVSRIEATRRHSEHKAVVQQDHGPDAKFVCALAINDMVMMPTKNGDIDLYRVQKMEINGQVCYRHHTAATLDDNSQRILQKAHLFTGQKVNVDMLGRIKPVE
jgi:CRISPR-associated endonuclease Csn1